MDFKDLCEFFDEIRQTKGPIEKQKVIREHFKKIREQLQNDAASFFQIFRLMLPNLDRERDSYNMKEAKVARTLIKMLDLPPGNDRNVLSKSYLMAGHANDFGDVVYSVIKKYLSSRKTSLTVQEVNNQLDSLTKRKNESEAEDIMMKMFKKASSEHVRWIIRIILKDLKLGISSNTIMNCYHRDAALFYASNNNLRKVCEILADSNVKLNELEIEIFEAFRPMLSKRIDATNFKKEFPDDKLFYLENKFDGERFQLHMKNNEFKYFSRNGFDFTDNLGKSYDTGIFTPKLKGLFHNSIKNVILDGELMLWNKFSKRFGSKGMTLDVKKLTDKGPYQPCFCIYDIIMLNNKVLTNIPLKERIKVLRGVFKNFKTGTLCLSEIKEVSSRQEIIDELNRAVDKVEEGIIIKDPDSIYKYSDRTSGWYKMKLEYFEDVMNDLDLILMGGIYASSTSDTLNSFIVGVRSGTENGKPVYLSMAKVSSGVNDNDLSMLNKKFKSEGSKFENFTSKNLMFGKETPNYYVEPEHALVFQVRATELIRNIDTSFKTSYTLRFPRILTIRDDKPVDECLNINELLELSQSNKSVIKLNKRNITLDEILKTQKRKVQKKDIIMPEIYNNDKVGDLLENFTIFVMSGSKILDKSKAESYIKQAGGKLAFILDEKVNIVLVGETSAKVKDLVRKNETYDIVNVSWLSRVIEDGNLLGYEQDEIYYLGNSYKNCLSDELDRFGDSYKVETTTTKLKRTYEIISEMGVSTNQNNTVHFTGFHKNFRQFVAYFDKYCIPDDSNSAIIYDSFIDQLEFRYYNGNISDSIMDKVNLIVYNGENDRKTVLEKYLIAINKINIEIRSKDFIYE